MNYVMSINNFKGNCYICWEDVDLIQCHQCKYGVCGKCLVIDDRFSTVVPKLCRHDECAYSYLKQEEIDKQNCFVCSKQPLFLEYRCGMCIVNSEIEMELLMGSLKDLSLRNGNILKEAEIINQTLVYYTIKDLDNGGVELKHFWEIPLHSNVNDDMAQSDYLVNQNRNAI
jgi:hypothetical protein